MSPADPVLGSSSASRTFRVYRYKRGDPRWRFDPFEVPVGPRTTVLDALRWIQLHRDGTLALRHSCFHASCGTCGMQVNGREVLACVTLADPLGSTITVEPLANIPVVTDLVVDMSRVFERFPDEIGIVRMSEELPEASPPVGIDALNEAKELWEATQADPDRNTATVIRRAGLDTRLEPANGALPQNGKAKSFPICTIT